MVMKYFPYYAEVLLKLYQDNPEKMKFGEPIDKYQNPNRTFVEWTELPDVFG